MRAATFAMALIFVATAWAEEPASPAPETAAAPSAVPAANEKASRRQVRYVNADGEALICKPVSGATGTRLKGRGKLICGTQAEWDDSHSEVNQMFDTMIRTNTPSPRG